MSTPTIADHRRRHQRRVLGRTSAGFSGRRSARQRRLQIQYERLLRRGENLEPVLSFGEVSQWWGPATTAGLIRSDAARPVAGFMLQRADQSPFETPWLSWDRPLAIPAERRPAVAVQFSTAHQTDRCPLHRCRPISRSWVRRASCSGWRGPTTVLGVRSGKALAAGIMMIPQR